jgi:arylsulfatase A-like enzyme
MLGESKAGREWVIEHAGTLALMEGDWKLIAPSNGQRVNANTNTELGNDPQPQLYDTARDPGEKNNLAAQYPERVQQMSAALEKFRAAERTRP